MRRGGRNTEHAEQIQGKGMIQYSHPAECQLAKQELAKMGNEKVVLQCTPSMYEFELGTVCKNTSLGPRWSSKGNVVAIFGEDPWLDKPWHSGGRKGPGRGDLAYKAQSETRERDEYAKLVREGMHENQRKKEGVPAEEARQIQAREIEYYQRNHSQTRLRDKNPGGASSSSRQHFTIRNRDRDRARDSYHGRDQDRDRRREHTYTSAHSWENVGVERRTR